MVIGASRCRVGVMLPMTPTDGGGRMPSWPDVLAFARHAEEASLDSVWVCDHFVSDDPDRPEDPPEGIHEAWTILAALAATTTRIGLGQLVMCVPFRSPGLLAKMAQTADAVSGGRLVLGLGAGWLDPEHRAFGFPTDHRAGRFEEALRIIGPLVRGERVSMEGRYHEVRDAALAPPPDRRIPILVAAEGPRMLRLTARHADAWNTAWYGRPDEALNRRVAELEAALEDEGREPGSLVRTAGVIVRDPDVAGPAGGGELAVDGSVDDLAGAIDAYGAVGFDELIVLLEPMTPRSIDRLARATALRDR